MHRIDSAGATGDNRFKATPLPATIVTSTWLNAVQEEIAKVIEDATGGNAGLVKGSNAQLLAAILAMVGRGVSDGLSNMITVSPGPTGEIKIGSVIIKWGGLRATITTETTLSVVFAQPFPTACWRVFPVPVVSSTSIDQNLWVQLVSYLVSETGFTILTQADSGGDQRLGGFDWLAIGN